MIGVYTVVAAKVSQTDSLKGHYHENITF